MATTSPITPGGYLSADFTVGYAAQSADFTIGQPLSADMTVAQAQSVDVTIARPASADVTLAQPRSADFTVVGPISANFTVAAPKSVDVTVAQGMSADLTVAASLCTDFTVQGQSLCADFTVASSLSTDFTVNPPHPQSADFTVQDPPLYTVSGPSQITPNADYTFTLTVRPGLLLSSDLAITPTLTDLSGNAVAVVFTPAPVPLTNDSPQATFTLNASASGGLLLSFAHTGPAGYDPQTLALTSASAAVSYVIRKPWGMDGSQHWANLACVVTSAPNSYSTQGIVYDNVGKRIGINVAYVQTIANAVGGQGALDFESLDWTYTTTALGPYEPGGAWPIYLGDNTLVVLYRAQDGPDTGMGTWWRQNCHRGEQLHNWDYYGNPTPNGGYGPPITRGTEPMGYWSARAQVRVDTSQWLQIVHGQGLVVALANTGTLTYTPSTRTYKRTRGALVAYYATDALCQTWTGPYQIADKVAPIMGGLCWTGAEWLACYTDNDTLEGRIKRTTDIQNWPVLGGGTNIIRPADDPQQFGQYVGAKELYCYGLTYDERNTVNGLWAPYDDTPETFTFFLSHSGSGDVYGTNYKSYGFYTSVVSTDQGQSWIAPLPNLGTGHGGVTPDGGAMNVDGTAFVRIPSPSAYLLRSFSAFLGDGGSIKIP